MVNLKQEERHDIQSNSAQGKRHLHSEIINSGQKTPSQ